MKNDFDNNKYPLISLNCPNCSATLSIPSNLEFITCNYCNSSLSLFRNESISALQLITKSIDEVKKGTDSIALEMKYKRLKNEIDFITEDIFSTMTFVGGFTGLPDWFMSLINRPVREAFFSRTGRNFKFDDNGPNSDNVISYIAPVDMELFKAEDLAKLVKIFKEESTTIKNLNDNDIFSIDYFIEQMECLAKSFRKLEVLKAELTEVKNRLL